MKVLCFHALSQESKDYFSTSFGKTRSVNIEIINATNTTRRGVITKRIAIFPDEIQSKIIPNELLLVMFNSIVIQL